MIPVIKKPDGTYACGPEEDREPEVGELFVEMDEYSKPFLNTLNGPTSKTGIVLARFDTSEFPNKPVMTSQCGWVEACGKMCLDTLGVNAFEAWEAKKRKAEYRTVVCEHCREEMRVSPMMLWALPNISAVRLTCPNCMGKTNVPVEKAKSLLEQMEPSSGKSMEGLDTDCATWKAAQRKGKELEKEMDDVNDLVLGKLQPKPASKIFTDKELEAFGARKGGPTAKVYPTLDVEKVRKFISGKQEAGPVDVKLHVSPKLGEAVAETMKEMGEKMIKGLGVPREYLEPPREHTTVGFPRKTRKLKSTWTVQYKERGRMVEKVNGVRVQPTCQRCGRKLEAIPLLTGYSDVCPECDK